MHAYVLMAATANCSNYCFLSIEVLFMSSILVEFKTELSPLTLCNVFIIDLFIYFYFYPLLLKQGLAVYDSSSVKLFTETDGSKYAMGLTYCTHKKLAFNLFRFQTRLSRKEL